MSTDIIHSGSLQIRKRLRAWKSRKFELSASGSLYYSNCEPNGHPNSKDPRLLINLRGSIGTIIKSKSKVGKFTVRIYSSKNRKSVKRNIRLRAKNRVLSEKWISVFGMFLSGDNSDDDSIEHENIWFTAQSEYSDADESKCADDTCNVDDHENVADSYLFQMDDCRHGIELFHMNMFDDAERYFQSKHKSDPEFASGYALMSTVPTDMQVACQRLCAAEVLALEQKKYFSRDNAGEKGFFGFRYSTVNSKNIDSDSKIDYQAKDNTDRKINTADNNNISKNNENNRKLKSTLYHLCAADSLLFRSLLLFLEESFISSIKGAWLLRKSFKTFESSWLHLNPGRTIGDHLSHIFHKLLEDNGNISGNFNGIQQITLSHSPVQSCSGRKCIHSHVSNDIHSHVSNDNGNKSNNYNIINKKANQTLSLTTRSPSLPVRTYCASSFGLGLFSTIISQLPPKVKKVIEILGFNGDLKFGLTELRRAQTLDCFHSSLSALLHIGLLTLRLIFGIFRDNSMMKEASEVLKVNRDRFPLSAVFRFFNGRLLRCKGRIDKAYEMYTETLQLKHNQMNKIKEVFMNPSEKQNMEEQDISSGKRYVQLDHLCHYELGWCCLLTGRPVEAASHFEVLSNNSKWSPAFYSYLAAVSHLEAAKSLRSKINTYCLSCKTSENIASMERTIYRESAIAEKLFFKVPSLARSVGFCGRPIPTEQYVIAKSKEYLNNIETRIPLDRLLVPQWEIMHFWSTERQSCHGNHLLQTLLRINETLFEKYTTNICPNCRCCTTPKNKLTHSIISSNLYKTKSHLKPNELSICWFLRGAVLQELARYSEDGNDVVLSLFSDVIFDNNELQNVKTQKVSFAFLEEEARKNLEKVIKDSKFMTNSKPYTGAMWTVAHAYTELGILDIRAVSRSNYNVSRDDSLLKRGIEKFNLAKKSSHNTTFESRLAYRLQGAMSYLKTLKE